SEGKPLSAKIADITEEPGLDGKPEVSVYDFLGSPSKAPWQKAKELAYYLRNKIDIGEHPVNDDTLYELLGLQKSEYEAWIPANRQPVSIAVPLETERFKFYPRKKHPIAKRFELARFLGDYLLYSNQGNSWLASTDLRTSRQKYQRAFAAEFLCPLRSLQSYLDNDYSESAIEDAAVYFNVSQKTVESIFANNGLIVAPQSIHDLETSLPY
ncbi:MAG: ImmA/IrrE family metallo-endopeptidase, partial [Planktothrix sp.]